MRQFEMKQATWFLSALAAVLAAVSITLAQPVNAQAQTGDASPQQPRDYLDLPVNIETPVQPTPVKGDDGKWYIVYHLFLTNWSFSDLTLKSVEVFNDERGKPVERYEERELSDFYRFRTLIPTPPRSDMPNNAYPRQIASGRTGVLFFWITVDAPYAVPSTLRHRFAFERNPLIRLLHDSLPGDNGEMVLRNFKVAVNKDKPVVIGAPVRGGNWVCANGPAYNTNHQFLTSRAGKVRIAQRFGIDFKKVDAGGNVLPSPFPDEITNKMFYGYGAEVVAVADGVVVFVKDGIPDNIPLVSGEIKPAVPLTRETNAGNWISIELGKKRYAFYAHLQPGSIRVKAGDKVRKGQLIGLLGNSGNSVGPHLHFHIGDEYFLNEGDLNGNEGLPFVFDSFEIVGQPRRHVLEMPLNNRVLRLP